MKIGNATVNGTKKRFLCTGGPYDGKRIPLRTGGTLPFKVGAWYGYYDSSNKWVSLA